MRWNYYKLRYLSYYKVRWTVITNCVSFFYKERHGLLQVATGITKCDEFITNCDRYYKVLWLLQIATVQQHTFFVNFFAVVFHDYNAKLPEAFLWRKCCTRPHSLFFTAAHSVSLHGWPPAFLILSLPLQNFHVVLPTKISPLFFLSHSRSLSPFFSLNFTGLPPTLSFSRSMFQICGHDNQSKLNTLDNMDTETIFAFRFRLYWLFSCFCF